MAFESQHRALRVLRVIARLNVGGPARQTIILNDRLRDLGFETLLVHGSVGAAEETLANIAHSRQLSVVHIPELGRRIHPADDARALVRLAALIHRWQPDVIHTHTAKAGALGRFVGAAYNATRPAVRRAVVLHTFHGHVLSGYFGPVGNAAVRVLERALAATSDCIVTISPSQRRELVTRFHVAPSSRTVVVPLGLELGELVDRLPQWRGIRTALGFRPEDFVVGYVGRLVPIKDITSLIRAVRIARDRSPNVKLVLAGDGEERAALKALVCGLGLQEHVRFLGWRSDLCDLYASFDVFALTSLNEGTPVSLIEAMAAGVPVIATSIGGVPDVLAGCSTATLVAPGAVTEIAAAIREAMVCPRTASELAQARSLIADRYDGDRLVRDIASLYTSLLVRKRNLRELDVRVCGSRPADTRRR